MQVYFFANKHWHIGVGNRDEPFLNYTTRLLQKEISESVWESINLFPEYGHIPVTNFLKVQILSLSEVQSTEKYLWTDATQLLLL